ncbi:S49 family peptidase [Botrimarina sp.]|uniref:S49 family peptidase n=1 Tax=Botrimarina sp. TaxID=2795802 RepID=UPI0032F051DE
MRSLSGEVAAVLPAMAQRLLADDLCDLTFREASGANAYDVATVDGALTPPDCERLRRWLLRAQEVTGRPFVLHFNCPGGLVRGGEETAELIARLAKRREVVALAEGYCCSLAYLLASQATRIIATPSSLLGSCGTLCMLVDTSQALAAAGLRVIPVTSHPRKAAGHPGVPISDEMVTDVQQRVDLATTSFERRLERSGRFSRSQLSTVMEAKVYTARQALRLAMVDEVALAEDVFTRMRKAPTPPTPRQQYAKLKGERAYKQLCELIEKRAGVSAAWRADESVRNAVRGEFPELAAEVNAWSAERRRQSERDERYRRGIYF